MVWYAITLITNDLSKGINLSDKTIIRARLASLIN